MIPIEDIQENTAPKLRLCCFAAGYILIRRTAQPYTNSLTTILSIGGMCGISADTTG